MSRDESKEVPASNQNPMPKLLIQGAISLMLLAAGLYVLVTVDWSKNSAMVAAATGWIGVVIGWWLK